MKELSLEGFNLLFCKSLRRDKRYCFILGAGASKSSGIPTGSELVNEWIEDLKILLGQAKLQEWKNNKNIVDDDLAKDYSKIFEKRFEIDPEDGYAFLEDIMRGKDPSCGYSVLAQILTDKEKENNVVITTNFDSLTEDALFVYTEEKPLVVGHEFLANYIRPFKHRPVIVKIHRDLFYDPMNKQDETNDMHDSLKKGLTNIFKSYIPLVIGYGGNDGSLMKFLESLDKMDGRIFWSYRKEDGIPNQRIQNLVEKFDGYFIPIPGFDHLMMQLGDELQLKPLDTKISEILERRIKTYREQIQKITEDADKDTQKAATNIVSRAPKEWQSYQKEALIEKNIDRRQQIYEEGLKELPESSNLASCYANFLFFYSVNYDKAEELYNKAMRFGPNNYDIIMDYIVFIINIRKDYKKAAKLYRKILDLVPNDIYAFYSINYIHTLIQIKEFDEIKKQIEITFELKNNDEDKVYDLMLWFLRFALFYHEYGQEAKEEIEELLEDEIGPADWTLDDVCLAARELGHPDYNEVIIYAKQITRRKLNE